MGAVFENQSQRDATRIASLENQAQEIERTLVNWRRLLEHQLTDGADVTNAGRDGSNQSIEENDEYYAPSHTIPDDSPARRTEQLISHGRASQRARRPARLWLLVAGGAALAGALVALLFLVVFTGSRPGRRVWPGCKPRSLPLARTRTSPLSRTR